MPSLRLSLSLPNAIGCRIPHYTASRITRVPPPAAAPRFPNRRLAPSKTLARRRRLAYNCRDEPYVSISVGSFGKFNRGKIRSEGAQLMDSKEPKRLSRRHFLMGIPLGIAGVFALNSLGGRFGGKQASSYPKFPEGSIFTPANDRADV